MEENKALARKYDSMLKNGKHGKKMGDPPGSPGSY